MPLWHPPRTLLTHARPSSPSPAPSPRPRVRKAKGEATAADEELLQKAKEEGGLAEEDDADEAEEGADEDAGAHVLACPQAERGGLWRGCTPIAF